MTDVLIKERHWTQRHPRKTVWRHKENTPFKPRNATRSQERGTTDFSLTALRRNQPCPHTTAPKYQFTFLCLANRSSLVWPCPLSSTLVPKTSLPRPTGQSSSSQRCLPATLHLGQSSLPLLGMFPTYHALPTSLFHLNLDILQAQTFIPFPQLYCHGFLGLCFSLSSLKHHWTSHLYHVSWLLIMSCLHSSLMAFLCSILRSGINF